MTAVEVHSRLIGARVRHEVLGVEACVTNVTTGEVPELFVRYVAGGTDWVDAKKWELVAVPTDPRKAAAQIQRHERNALPEIPYVSQAHV